MGGNVLLKYLGEQGQHTIIKKAVGVSVTIDLKSTALHLEKGFNKLYLHRFLVLLKRKIRLKQLDYPDAIDYSNVYKAKNFRTLDEYWTAPIHGYKGALDYWQKCSSKQFLADIRIPTMVINALNDPFITEESYPVKECKQNDKLMLDAPKHGGHVGFPKMSDGMNYYESKIIEFFVEK